MKKFGQVTMFGNNYGACLQAFALQHILLENGFEVELVNYGGKKIVEGENVNPIVRTIKKMARLGIFGVVKYIINYSYIKNNKAAYNNFRKNHLKISSKIYYRNKNLNELNNDYDFFIAGSDMLWSEEFLEDWKFYFLSFAPKEKCFSYAPSFGQNALSAENVVKVKSYLEKISKLSCREEKGVKLIKDITSLDVPQVVDPTLLLDANIWNEIIGNNDRIIKNKYCFGYLFGSIDSARKELLRKLKSGFDKVYRLSNKKEGTTVPMDYVSPIEYLRLFRDSEFVITDTFHGLMFSIIFRKPFIVLERHDGSKWAKQSDRMVSTLEMFGLADRYVNPEKIDISKYLTLDYTKYEEKIEFCRNKSLNYLMAVLEENR